MSQTGKVKEYPGLGYTFSNDEGWYAVPDDDLNESGPFETEKEAYLSLQRLMSAPKKTPEESLLYLFNQIDEMEEE